ncbi:VanW family protein [Hazenella coriacea]|uniref:Vancomycin resistance protein YoaR n=1 Tax=Hazenella coriacea TaxID=1179467 RepID=A0A4R3L2Y1_9BACL|nr:VanW family protein [Hazenella coriacea]TCS92803.1 vancomycin resistance protein YoaR [Hazenella coriacea]
MEENKKVGSESETDQSKKVEQSSQGESSVSAHQPEKNNSQIQSSENFLEKDQPKDELDSKTDSKTQEKPVSDDQSINQSSESTEEQNDLPPSDHSSVEEPKMSFYWGSSTEQKETSKESDKSIDSSSEKNNEEQTHLTIEESKPSPVTAHEPVNDTKEEVKSSSPKDDRAFNTMEFRAFDQWKTEEGAPSSTKENQEEVKSSSPKDDRAFNTMEFRVFDQWKTEEGAPSSTKENQESELPSDAQAPAKSPKQVKIPKQTDQAKPKHDPKRKKLIGGIVAASLFVVGSIVAYTLIPFGDGAPAVAEAPTPQPANLQLLLDDQKYELDLYQVGYNGQDLATVDEMKLRTWLDEVKKKVDQPAEDAKLKWFGKEITPEKSGRKMDVEAVEAWLSDLKLLVNKPQQIPMVPEEPLVTAEDLRQVDQKLMGKYRTTFDGGNTNRTTNIRLSSKAIDNLILMPGEEFSFNRVVGERTTARGYKSAGVIVKGEFSEGIGGGICQVSSTLFNSVDDAGLKITRVQHHSAEVTYVPPGRDATVSWGGPDFRFKNNLNKPVLIKVNVGSNAMTVSTYTAPNAKKYKVKKDDQPDSFVAKKESDQKETSTDKK